jgi:predicted transcriptional regulator
MMQGKESEMLEVLLGSRSCEQVLLFMLTREEGYSREIARFFDVDYRPIRNQLDKLEAGGVLVSRQVGKTRLYSFSARCPYLKELKELLQKVMTFCPDDPRERLLMSRRRPRGRGKPL